MLPTIYLIRHGLTDANRDGIVAGFFEAKLLPEGIEQARQAGAFLKDRGIKKIFCSPMIRTRQTLDALGLAPKDVELGGGRTVFDERLKEINCGIYEGTRFVDMPRQLRREELFWNPDLRRPEGETVNEVCARMRSFIDERLKSAPGPVLIVTHASAGRAFLLEYFPALRERILEEEMGNAEVWKIQKGNYQKVFEPKN